MFKINLYTKSEYISNYIRKYGYWEKTETEILYEIFKNNKNISFIDIGGNLGYFSLLAGHLGINTISFEPIRKNYELFQKSIIDNNFSNIINLYKFGLGDKEEIKEFCILDHNMGCCTQRHNIPVGTDYTRENVSIKLADEFLYEIDNDMVIKIDVENMESEVINGMLKTLSKGKIKYLLMEISKGTDSSNVFDILQRYNFNRGLLLEDLIKIDDNTGINLNTTYLSNIDLFKPLNIFKEEYDKADRNYQRNFLFIKT